MIKFNIQIKRNRKSSISVLLDVEWQDEYITSTRNYTTFVISDKGYNFEFGRIHGLVTCDVPELSHDIVFIGGRRSKTGKSEIVFNNTREAIDYYLGVLQVLFLAHANNYKKRSK